MNYRLAMPGAPAKPFEKMTKEERALWEPVRAEVVQLIKAQPHLVPRPLLPSCPSPFPTLSAPRSCHRNGAPRLLPRS
jgi:hypothetical protein